EESLLMNFIDELEMVRKGIFFRGFLLLQKLKYKKEKQFTEDENNVYDMRTEKKNFIINKYKKFKKTYVREKNPTFEKLLCSEESFYKFIREIYRYQEDVNYYNLLNKEKNPHYSEIQQINSRCINLVSPQDSSSVLLFGKDYHFINLSETKILFNLSISKM